MSLFRRRAQVPGVIWPRPGTGGGGNIATKPSWVMSVLNSKHRTFGNLEGRVSGMSGVKSLAEWTADHSRPLEIGEA